MIFPLIQIRSLFTASAREKSLARFESDPEDVNDVSLSRTQ